MKRILLLLVVICITLSINTDAAKSQNLKHGTGYTPRSNQVYYRNIPGAAVISHVQGNLNTPDPWEPGCTGQCVADRYYARYGLHLTSDCNGVSDCVDPLVVLGGWVYGPSNERAGLGVAALEYFCNNDPQFIGSLGKAGGWDCIATTENREDIGAFGGEYIVTQWVKLTQTAPMPTPKPTPQPSPSPSPTPLPVPSPSPTPPQVCPTCPPQKVCGHAVPIVVPQHCLDVVKNLVNKSVPSLLLWRQGRLDNMKECAAFFDSLSQAWVEAQNTSTGSVSTCLDLP